MAHHGGSTSSSGSGWNKVLKDFVLGGTSGAIAKTIAAPIERVKLLLQTQANNPKLAERPYTGKHKTSQVLSTAS
jgi:solute carrier family 25 (adenine nucleotide translocator) protein 4/5/6/31